MKTQIRAASYADALDEIVSRLQNRTPSLDERHILVVPDVYTFALEKRLFLPTSGAFDLEVTTFNRMYKRLVTDKRVLPKQGAVMLLKRLCAKNAEKLTCYARSASKSGFALKLYDAINRLRSCSVTPDGLTEARSVIKAADIALLYREYLAATEGRLVDAGGRLALLREHIAKSNELSDCHIYITLYDTLSAEAVRLIDGMTERCRSLTVATVDAPRGYKVSAPTEIQGCSDRVTQYKLAAKKIREFVTKTDGARYGDICVVDCTADKSVPRRVFSEYGIPYYAGEKLALSETELSRFIFSVLENRQRSFRTDGMLALAANYYSGVKKHECDAFCSFVRRRCVDYLAFTKPFEADDPQTEIAEGVRKRLISLISCVGRAETASGFFAEILTLLEKSNAKSLTDELSQCDGRDLTAIYDKAVELIGLAGELYGDERVSADELTATLHEGFVGTEISLVPNESDTVQVGPLSQFRGQRPKMAVIVEFNEGVLPVLTPDDGLLTDADAHKMEKYRLSIEPRAEQMNELCRGELWHFLQSARRLFITYSEAAGDKPSYELRRLASVNGIDMKTQGDYEGAAMEERDPEKIAAMLGGRAGALETALIGEGLPYRSSVAAAIDLDLESIRPPVRPFSEQAKRIFSLSDITSVSALQAYFTCPFAYFMSQVLRVESSHDGRVTPLDIGQLIHKIVERFVSEGMPEDIRAFVSGVIPKVLEQYEKYTYSANEEIFARLIEQAVTLCGVVADQIREGSFVPFKTECGFGKEGSELETVDYGGVRLIGEIDRIDLYGNYARVIDYKTGNASFSYGDLYYGRKIQLIAYLMILMENGYEPAGAFYFPCSTSWQDDELSHRLSGPFNSDPEIVAAMDEYVMMKGGKSTVLDASVTLKDGNASFRSKRAVTKQQLEMMAQYVNALIDGALKEIREGNIQPSPAVSDKRSACDYCDYRTVCSDKRERVLGGADLSDIIGAVTPREE